VYQWRKRSVWEGTVFGQGVARALGSLRGASGRPKTKANRGQQEMKQQRAGGRTEINTNRRAWRQQTTIEPKGTVHQRTKGLFGTEGSTKSGRKAQKKKACAARIAKTPDECRLEQHRTRQRQGTYILEGTSGAGPKRNYRTKLLLEEKKSGCTLLRWSPQRDEHSGPIEAEGGQGPVPAYGEKRQTRRAR